MSVASKPNKKFKLAYDLSRYTINLSLKEKRRFELNPTDSSSNLPTARFDAPTVEERARWYKVIKNATRGNAARSMSGMKESSDLPSDDVMLQKRAENLRGEFDSEDIKTLNGISSFLTDNSKLLENA